MSIGIRKESARQLSRPRNRRLAYGRWFVVLLLPLTLMIQGARPLYAAPSAQSASDPLVLAFYYPW
jgi:hypothetical protein